MKPWQDYAALLKTLRIAALFSAVMFSIDSGINAVCLVLNIDLYRRFFRPHTSEGDELKHARWTTFICGITVIAIALFVLGETGLHIIERQFRMASYASEPLFAIFAGGMFFSKNNTFGVLVGSSVSLFLGILIAFPPDWFPHISPSWIIPVTSMVALIVSCCFSWLAANRMLPVKKEFTFHSLMINEGDKNDIES